MRISPHYLCPGIDPKKGGAGVIRAVYYREGKKWIRAGYLCLTCRAFNPNRPWFPTTQTGPLPPKSYAD